MIRTTRRDMVVVVKTRRGGRLSKRGRSNLSIPSVSMRTPNFHTFKHSRQDAHFNVELRLRSKRRRGEVDEEGKIRTNFVLFWPPMFWQTKRKRIEGRDFNPSFDDGTRGWQATTNLLIQRHNCLLGREDENEIYYRARVNGTPFALHVKVAIN